MVADPSTLAELLRQIEASPQTGAVRLEAAVLANQLALSERSLWYADVAEALGEEEAPGATRVLRSALAEQARLAVQVRRQLLRGAAPEATSGHSRTTRPGIDAE